MDQDVNYKISSLLTWVNSFKTDEKIDDLSQLSDGLVLAQCLKLLGFRPDVSFDQPPLEFVASKLSDFYCCDLLKCGVLELSKISIGEEEEIVKVLVLLLCMAVKHGENESFIEAILSLPDDVQFGLKYFIETGLEQIDNGRLFSGDFVLGVERQHSVGSTPTCSSLSTSNSFHSPALQRWLCSPSITDEATPKIPSNQLFECVEVKELRHQLKMLEKELEIQRSLVTDYEGEIELLNEQRSNLSVNVAEKDERIRQLQDKCEELEHLEDVEIKLQKAEEEIKNLKQQLELAREGRGSRNELQQKITNQDEELKELYQAKNLFQVKLLKYQHQVQELELECKSQQAQSARNLKRCNEAVEKIDLLEKQNNDLLSALRKEKEIMVETCDQNTLLRQQNCGLNNELAVLQEQYTTVMCTVGSQGQENERLQHALHDMEEKYTGELDAKEQQLKMLQEQVTLLTTRVEKLLVDIELQTREFDEKEAMLKTEWQEKIRWYEAKSSSELSKAEEMVKSCQLEISNLTRERDEGRILTVEQLSNLEATYKEKVNSLECQISECKETAELQLRQQELQLKETREGLGQKNEQLERCHEMIALLEQKLTSAETDRTEAEKQHQQELWQHTDELDKLNSEYELKVLELSQQLEKANGKVKMLVHENKELREMIVEKGTEYDNLQSEFDQRGKDHLQQYDKLTKEKDKLMSNLKQNQAVAKQQIEMMAEELKQLRNEKSKITDEYQAYRSVTQQKEGGLLHEVKELKQEKETALQKAEQLTGQLKQYQETSTTLQQKLSSSLASHAEVEELHQKMIQQHSIELGKLNDEHKLKVLQLSQQLEMMTKEHETFRAKISQQFSEESEKFSHEVARIEAEYADLQNMFNKQEKDYLQQLEKLAEDKDELLVDLKQSQLVAKQQVEQLHHDSKELERLCNEKLEMSSEYEAYRSMIQEKEVSLLHEVAEIKQEKDVALQKLEDSLSKLALMEAKQSKLFVQIENLNNALQCAKNEHRVEIESYQAAVDKELSANDELEMKNKLLLQELSSVKQESLMVAEKLQSCVDARSLSLWKQQVKQLEDDLHEVRKQLSAKELSTQQLTKELFTSKQAHCKALSLLEQRKEEIVKLESSHQTQRKNMAALLEEKETKIALLHSQLANEKQQSKIELEAVCDENEKLLKSVDKLCSQQVAANSEMEQECQKKFNILEQSNTEKMEEIAKMQVEMTSLLNELQVLRVDHKEVTDCLSIEREKNSSLENVAKELKATIKAYEKENARVHKLMVQQRHAVRPPEDEQTHLQQLHSEMDRQASSHVIPMQPAEEDERSGSRLEELRARNSFHPPHLKSCYPVELQLHCGTPRSSQLQELQMKGALEKKSGYFEVSPPHKRNMALRQQLESPDSVKRRLSAPPTPTPASQPLPACRISLRSYLNDEQDENKPPLSRPSDAFEISLSTNEQSRVKMEERRSKMFQRMAATRKTQQLVQRSTTTVNKPLRVRNAPKKKK